MAKGKENPLEGVMRLISAQYQHFVGYEAFLLEFVSETQTLGLSVSFFPAVVESWSR